jgi:hypothetical protein
MLFDTVIFALMARNYKYVTLEPKEDTPGTEKGNEIEETIF